MTESRGYSMIGKEGMRAEGEGFGKVRVERGDRAERHDFPRFPDFFYHLFSFSDSLFF